MAKEKKIMQRKKIIFIWYIDHDDSRKVVSIESNTAMTEQNDVYHDQKAHPIWAIMCGKMGEQMWLNSHQNQFLPKGMREVELTKIEVLWYFDHTMGPPCCAKHWWVLSLPQYHLIIHHPPVISPKKVISKDANRLQRTFLNFYFFASLKRLDWLD